MYGPTSCSGAHRAEGCQQNGNHQQLLHVGASLNEPRESDTMIRFPLMRSHSSGRAVGVLIQIYHHTTKGKEECVAPPPFRVSPLCSDQSPSHRGPINGLTVREGAEKRKENEIVTG